MYKAEKMQDYSLVKIRVFSSAIGMYCSGFLLQNNAVLAVFNMPFFCSLVNSAHERLASLFIYYEAWGR